MIEKGADHGVIEVIDVQFRGFDAAARSGKAHEEPHRVAVGGRHRGNVDRLAVEWSALWPPSWLRRHQRDRRAALRLARLGWPGR